MINLTFSLRIYFLFSTYLFRFSYMKFCRIFEGLHDIFEIHERFSFFFWCNRYLNYNGIEFNFCIKEILWLCRYCLRFFTIIKRYPLSYLLHKVIEYACLLVIFDLCIWWIYIGKVFMYYTCWPWSTCCSNF